LGSCFGMARVRVFVVISELEGLVWGGLDEAGEGVKGWSGYGGWSQARLSEYSGNTGSRSTFKDGSSECQDWLVLAAHSGEDSRGDWAR